MPIALGTPTYVGLSANTGTGSYNGLQWGPGTHFHISAINLDDLPSMRSNDSPRPLDPGTFSGFDFPDGRTFNLDVTIISDDNATYHTDLAALQRAFVPLQSSTLPMLLFNSQRLINCRVRQRAVPYDATYQQRVVVASFQMFAPDPRVYDAALQTLSCGLANAGSGFAFPIVWPISFGTGPIGGSFQVTNLGNFGSRPVFTITGPVTNPNIQNASSGQELAFNIDLADGDSLVIDTDARSIVLNGTAGRRNALTASSQWFELAPGISTIEFQAFSSSASPTLQMTASSAWI